MMRIVPTHQELLDLVHEYFVAERLKRHWQSVKYSDLSLSDFIDERYKAFHRYNRVRCAMLMLVFGDDDQKARELWVRTPPPQGMFNWQYILDDMKKRQQTTGEQQ